MPKNGTGYRILNTNIENKCKQTKDEWINKKCARIEKLSNIDTVYIKGLKKTTELGMCFSTECIKLKKGNIHNRD